MLDFIVNPCSSSNTKKSVWEDLEQVLLKNGVDYSVHFTEYKSHATQIARDITCDGQPHTLVILGGDGSINEVVNGILYPSRTTIGYIPLGSGNDFARSFHIPSNPQKALDFILHSPHTRTLNLGHLVCGNQEKYRFAVSSGMGYDASICHRNNDSNLKRILNYFRLGHLSYVALSIKTLLDWKPCKMEITIDGAKTLHFNKIYFAAAMNLPYEGGGCKFCPNAKPDDGFLDLIVIADVPKLAALSILPAVFSGKHTHMRGVHIFRFKSVKIKSSEPLVLHTDGEPVPESNSIIWNLESESLKLIVP